VCCSVLQRVADLASLKVVILTVLECLTYVAVLQCVAVCCSVLQCLAVRCSMMQTSPVSKSYSQLYSSVWGTLQCVAVCCSVLQCAAASCRPRQSQNRNPCCTRVPEVQTCRRTHLSRIPVRAMLQRVAASYSALQSVAVCCGALQSVAEHRRVLQCVAVIQTCPRIRP